MGMQMGITVGKRVGGLHFPSRMEGNIISELHRVHLRNLTVLSPSAKAVINSKSQILPTHRQHHLRSFFPEIHLCPVQSRYSQRFQFHSVRSHQGTEPNVILKSVSRTAEVSVLCISANEAVEEACVRHKAAPMVQFAGDGPLGQITTIASGEGLVKGFVGNPMCNLPITANQMINVGEAVGSGLMSVVCSHSKWPQPYIGSIPIYSGEIAEDFAHYLAESEQMKTAIGIGVTFTRKASVKSAHGFLVQVLPFCSEETIVKLEENIRKMPSLSDATADRSAYNITEDILMDIGIGDTYNLGTPRYGPCDLKDLKLRMLRAVASLGSEDIKSLLQEQGHIEVRCEFCAEVLRFKENDVQDIIQS
ncbi:uncharacterized protein LOC131048267 isoform X4 [Cryptomeria japonica]|uniref:uncharacterized protein LOC131048267 isoform X4 n=1 Tax=Cryptomeria japonica TaxID=3369 RepID=UPI0027DA8E66|nr:uncharacterized protein LOC131048267 isoform X4 [Cryptomeria japonica]